VNSSAALVHLLGFLAGIVLYAMLGVMTLRSGRSGEASGRAADRIPLATSGLGLLWNAGALVIYGTRDLGGAPNAWFEAAAFAALGFLPAVVVHSSLQAQERRSARMLIGAAYALSAAGALLQLRAAFAHEDIPSSLALTMLTAGYIAVIALLALLAPEGPRAAPIGTGLFDIHVDPSFILNGALGYSLIVGGTVVRPQLFVDNIFDKRYLLKGAFFSGTSVGRPRTLELRVDVGV